MFRLSENQKLTYLRGFEHLFLMYLNFIKNIKLLLKFI
ncbi:hypothetical protein HMPREF1054_0154 [Haemophilus paraphrohaemolyticus HK411]|uniref:Uncharacterized protein n=1 Tax=Haemophilus paraphrohaemolyticus HK411 TaxID=1095743 RepID=I2NJ53_9PAST|nr:hypothetical protein HMPREF1054_0154 [Haemophilus paraphrohaemolyticus HK411]